MSSAKILIVDDAQQVRRVLRTALSAEGYTIFEAGTGEEALESVRKSTPDAILLDVNMPGIGGLETCREIRRTLDVPIVAFGAPKDARLENGRLADVAPTLLDLMDLEKPQLMTGRSLLVREALLVRGA